MDIRSGRVFVNIELNKGARLIEHKQVIFSQFMIYLNWDLQGGVSRDFDGIWGLIVLADENGTVVPLFY